jgi:hypothetical protein
VVSVPAPRETLVPPGKPRGTPDMEEGKAVGAVEDDRISARELTL